MPSRHLDPAGWRPTVESRSLDLLLPTPRQMANHFLAECLNNMLDVVVVSTFRDHEAQKHAYARGLSKYPPGWSWHQHNCAFNVILLRYGKLVGDRDQEDLELWEFVGRCGKVAGLEWGGDWPDDKREVGHFQYTFGRTIQDVLRGVPLGETLDGHVTRFGGNGKDHGASWLGLKNLVGWFRS